MASQYQHRQFFRRVPNTLLAHYFEVRDTDLSVEQQAAMEVDFQDINALASDGGIDMLCNEAAFYEDDHVRFSWTKGIVKTNFVWGE